MSDEIATLKEKIAKMEEAAKKNSFGALFDKQKADREYKKLKKLKRELIQLEDQLK